MAAGDNFKVWFPEMVQIIKDQWHSKLSWDEMGVLCSSMMDYRDELRKEKGIKNAVTLCNKCGNKHELKLVKITIRSLLFALKKNNVIDVVTFEKLDLSWKKHQRVSKKLKSKVIH
jgi:hypothetical protein